MKTAFHQAPHAAEMTAYRPWRERRVVWPGMFEASARTVFKLDQSRT